MRPTFILILLIALICLPVTASAETADTEGIVGLTDEDVTVLTLDNGMTFLLMDRKVAPTISTIVRFNVGSVDEWPGITGTSHLLEHMLFKGTNIMGTTDAKAERRFMREIDATIAAIDAELARLKADGHDPFWYDEVTELASPRLTELKAKRSELQNGQREFIVKNELWATYMENGGTGLNASTGNDTTQYYVSLPKNRIELWAFMESDRMANPVFREFYSERDVVQEERRLRTDTQPFGRLFEAFSTAAYTAHPYRWPVIGWMSDLKTVRLEEVEKYFIRYYAPNNAVVAMVGDLDIPETSRIIKKYFNPIPRQPAPDPVQTREPKQKGERRVEVEFDSNPYIAVGWHTPAYDHPDTPALEFLGRILSRGKTSRFHKSIIQDQRIAMFVSGRAEASKYPGTFTVFGAPRFPNTVETLEAAIYAEIEKIQKDGINEWELNKLKNQEQASFVRSLGSNSGLASRLSRYHLRYGDWKEMLNRQEVMAGVTAEDIQRVAGKYLKKNNRTVAWLVRPEGSKADPGAGGNFRRMRQGMSETANLPYPLDELMKHALWAEDLHEVPAKGGAQ